MSRRLLLLIVLLISFSAAWSEDLGTILKTGTITVGIRQISSATYLGEDYTDKGFCYDLAKAFANDLEVDMNLKIVKTFSEYWENNGGTIYDTIDMAADIITVTDKRKEMVNMVPFVENTELFFGKKNLEIKTYEDLRNLRILTYESFSFYKLLLQELSRRNIPSITNVVRTNEQNGDLIFPSGRKKIPKDGVEILLISKGNTPTKFIAYYQILLDHADVSIQDAFSFFLHYYATPLFEAGLKPMFPVTERPNFLAFCTSYRTPQLNHKLSAFMENYRKTEAYNILFRKYMGISYPDYKTVLNLETSNQE